ncbi:MAG: Gfo/Idh/MocA family oxidoreductase, partial [Flavobacteriales bacterium]
GLDISRADFYQKEISFQVSCSYGPGRYDDAYENKGIDYPIGYVRWTEKRNFEAVLNAMSKGALDVKPLITERIPLIDYQKIYGDMGNSKSIASILEYNATEEPTSTVTITPKSFEGKKGVIGIIGAGNFTSATVLPNLKKLNASIKYIASSGGLSSTTMAKKYKIVNSTTNYKEILNDTEVDLVFITTKHHMHAPMVLETLKAGKSVFVEKPLALTKIELDEISEEYHKQNVNVSVGYNRRFAPLAKKMKSLLGNDNTPMNIIATMNAGFIPANVWVQDMEVGGGRIIGEACHYIDLCTYLSASKVIAVCMNAMGTNPQENTDNASILLKYENGSNAVINYFANGSKAYAKERLEVFSQERTLIMDNWRKLKTFGFKGSSDSSSKQDKGHYNQFNKLIEQQQKGGNPMIPFDEIVNTTRASFAAIESLKEGKWISIK